MENKKVKREGFSTGIAVFFATLGSAVGLGNIWKFPSMVGTFGGAAFLFVYLLCVAFVALPVMVSEFYIGRRTRKNAVGAYKKLKGDNTPWKMIGLMGVLSAYLIMFFYSDVAGWVYSYIFKAIKGDFAHATTAGVASQFGKAVVGPASPIVWQAIVLVVVACILIAGVKKGIERVTKTLLPVLFVLIIICDIRALTLKGASAGLNFLYNPDFSKITGTVILNALGLAFFKLSLGMGTMTTYGSYITEDNNMIGNATRVAGADVIVSLLAGMAIFPVVFTFGLKPNAGSSLLFQTIPLVFSHMPLGNILLPAFFLLTGIAATTAMISLVEVPVAYFTEEKGMSRKSAVIMNVAIIFVLGLLATLSADSTSILGKIHIFGKSFFDLFDFVSSNILMTVGGLLTVLFAGWFTKKDEFVDEVSNHGMLKNKTIIEVSYFFIKFIAPILMLIVFLNSLGLLKFLGIK